MYNTISKFLKINSPLSSPNVFENFIVELLYPTNKIFVGNGYRSSNLVSGTNISAHFDQFLLYLAGQYL
jgi:hypothetical protein